jgi:bifunctional UDP-N-acetylglucosamine pyrophosphorylase/glucosamine-1-phosphate N-acetyltransferase
MNQKKAAIILAAGRGTRMKSSMPKVLHPLANKPIIHHVIDACQNANVDDLLIVVAPDMPELSKAVNPIHTEIQEKATGTGDAAKAAKVALDDYEGYIFILNGDLPFIQAQTLDKLYDMAQDTGLAILGFETDDPYGYGRLVTNNKHHVTKIVEEKDCTPDQRTIKLGNAGAYCVKGDKLFGWLDQLSNDNAQGEYYLTDIIAIAAENGVACQYALGNISETVGINSRAQLAEAEKILQTKLRKTAMDQGVTMIDPETVYLSADTQFEKDITIEPNVFFGPGVTVGTGTIIHAFSHLEGVKIGAHASIGPFARLRPKSKIGDHVTVGNFIEVNRSELKAGAKSKHVSYLGDAVIGENTNIGAGTIIANYDGFNKKDTLIGNGAFIGSNSTIIAPVTIGEGAIVAAGSTITNNVGDNDLAVARAKQVISENWAIGYRTRNRNDK